MFSAGFFWPPAQFWKETPAMRCWELPLLTRNIRFSQAHYYFFKPQVFLFLSHPIEWVGLLWEGAGSVQTHLTTPSRGEKRGAGFILQPCLGLGSLPQSPQIPGTVCSRGPVVFQFPWALQGWCTHAGMPGRCRRRGQRCRGYHVTPHRAHHT